MNNNTYHYIRHSKWTLKKHKSSKFDSLLGDISLHIIRLNDKLIISRPKNYMYEWTQQSLASSPGPAGRGEGGEGKKALVSIACICVVIIQIVVSSPGHYFVFNVALNKWPGDEVSGLAHRVVYNLSNTTSICGTIIIHQQPHDFIWRWLNYC